MCRRASRRRAGDTGVEIKRRLFIFANHDSYVPRPVLRLNSRARSSKKIEKTCERRRAAARTMKPPRDHSCIPQRGPTTVAGKGHSSKVPSSMPRLPLPPTDAAVTRPSPLTDPKLQGGDKSHSLRCFCFSKSEIFDARGRRFVKSRAARSRLCYDRPNRTQTAYGSGPHAPLRSVHEKFARGRAPSIIKHPGIAEDLCMIPGASYKLKKPTIRSPREKSIRCCRRVIGERKLAPASGTSTTLSGRRHSTAQPPQPAQKAAGYSVHFSWRACFRKCAEMLIDEIAPTEIPGPCLGPVRPLRHKCQDLADGEGKTSALENKPHLSNASDFRDKRIQPNRPRGEIPDIPIIPCVKHVFKRADPRDPTITPREGFSLRAFH